MYFQSTFSGNGFYKMTNFSFTTRPSLLAQLDSRRGAACAAQGSEIGGRCGAARVHVWRACANKDRWVRARAALALALATCAMRAKMTLSAAARLAGGQVGGRAGAR